MTVLRSRVAPLLTRALRDTAGIARRRLHRGRRSSSPGAGSQKWEPTCSAALGRSTTQPDSSRRSRAPRSTQSDGDRHPERLRSSLTRKRSQVQILYGPRHFEILSSTRSSKGSQPPAVLPRCCWSERRTLRSSQERPPARRTSKRLNRAAVAAARTCCIWRRATTGVPLIAQMA
jgi:hypothetical protein